LKKVLTLIKWGNKVPSFPILCLMDVQTASKKDLMCIKGIGEKKATAIIEYRKKNKLKSVDDLLKIKGFGKSIIDNIKKENKNAKCLKKGKATKQEAKKEPVKVEPKEANKTKK